VGYFSRLHGRLEVVPPLKWRDVKNSKFAAGSGLLRYEIKTTTVSGSEDDYVQRTIVAVVPASTGDVRAYDLDDEIGELIREVTGLGSRVAGAIVRSGEDPDDLERYLIDKTHSVINERAQLVWPDGSEAIYYDGWLP
jgi:hypothetical protein